MRPILHMGLGWDEFHLRALVDAGFATSDLVLIARTKANAQWARRRAPRAEVVFLPYVEALSSNPVVGSVARPALLRAAEGSGMEPWDIIMAERALRRRPADVAITFANLAADRLAQVVESVGPTIAVAEFTVTSEIILSGLVAQSGGLPFWPRTLRLPSDRFGLFSTPCGIRYLPRKEKAVIAADHAHELLDDAVAGKTKPLYFASNAKAEGPAEIFRLVTDRLREFRFERGTNLQLPKPSDYAVLPWLNVVRGRQNMRSYRRRRWDRPPSGRFVLFPLHVQPESTVDAMAPRWRDQAYAALRMAEALAHHGMRLVVKEHSNFIWRRDPSFWRELDRHPNVDAVDPTTRVEELIARAEWVFTPTGTAGLEAALRGHRVVMGAPMSWTALPNVAYVTSPEEMAEFIRNRGWEALEHDPDATYTWWREDYLANSYPGVALDPPRFPGVLEPRNTARFGVAYRDAAASVV